MDMESITDSTSHRNKALVDLSYPMREVVEAGSLLREVPWSTKAAEDMHGSIVVVHRAHPDLDGTSLATRSFLHATRALFREDSDRKVVQRLEAKVQRLATNRGRAVAAHNHFFADLVGRSQKTMELKGFRRGLQTAIMKQGMCRYKRLRPQQKAHYQKRATAETTKRLQSLKDDRAHDRAALQLHVVRIAAEVRQRCVPNSLSQCRFDDDDVRRLQEAMASPVYSEPVIEQRMSQTLRGPSTICLLYTSPSPRDLSTSRMPSSA